MSQVAGADVVKRLGPDIVGHVTGGPIPMAEADVAALVADTDCGLEICSSGNPRMVLSLIRAAAVMA